MELGWSDETDRYDAGREPRAARPRCRRRCLRRRPPAQQRPAGAAAGLAGAEIRAWLREHLPGADGALRHRRPSTSCRSPPNGKIDRRRPARPTSGRRTAAPRRRRALTDTERRLAALWAQTSASTPSASTTTSSSWAATRSSHQAHRPARRRPGSLHAQAALPAPDGRASSRRSSRPRARVEPEQGPVVGPVPLTPIQHWFFEQRFAETHHFNQAALLAVPAGIDAAMLVRALQAVIAHHDALHLRFQRPRGSGTSTATPPDASWRSPPRTSRRWRPMPSRLLSSGRAAGCRRRCSSRARCCGWRCSTSGRRGPAACSSRSTTWPSTASPGHPAGGPLARLRPAGPGAAGVAAGQDLVLPRLGRPPVRTCRRLSSAEQAASGSASWRRCTRCRATCPATTTRSRSPGPSASS